MKSFFQAMTITALVLVSTACPPREPLGYQPPPAADQIGAFEANWRGLEVISGSFRTTFRYSDGQKVTLTANLVVDGRERSFVELSSDRGMEALVVVNASVINLVHIRDRYHVREENNRENAGRLIGLYLPPQEVAAVLAGRGLLLERFEQMYSEPDEDGRLQLSGYHATENLRASALIDGYGRLLSIRYIDTTSDEAIVEARYLGFRLDKATGLVWPSRIEVDLLRTGDGIVMRAADVDLNNKELDLNYIFTPRETRRGSRLRLEDVPPGPPLLYRSAKEYVR